MDTSINEIRNQTESKKLTVTAVENKNGLTSTDALLIKDRSKNGSEPVGGLSKGHLKI